MKIGQEPRKGMTNLPPKFQPDPLTETENRQIGANLRFAPCAANNSQTKKARTLRFEWHTQGPNS